MRCRTRPRAPGKKQIRKRIEVVITGLTRNQVAFTGSWVRIPPLPPSKNPVTMRVSGFFLFYVHTKNHPIFSCSFHSFGKNSFSLYSLHFFAAVSHLLPKSTVSGNFFTQRLLSFRFMPTGCLKFARLICPLLQRYIAALHVQVFCCYGCLCLRLQGCFDIRETLDNSFCSLRQNRGIVVPLMLAKFQPASLKICGAGFSHSYPLFVCHPP